MEKLLDAMLAAFDAGNMEETNRILEKLFQAVDRTTASLMLLGIFQKVTSPWKKQSGENKRIRKV